MTDKYIDIHVEGEEKIQAALRMQGARQEANLREMVDELADVASLALIMNVPRRNDYIIEHIDRAGATWMPGGSGGGGEYKAIVGIKEGSSRHPIYVEFGTGIYAGRGLIWPTRGPGVLTGKHAPVMRFEKRGESGGKGIFRYWTRGQRGQHYFYLTWRVLNAVAEARILAKKLL
jgi:hypothetical protein